MTKEIFVPRLMDAANLNAQNSNARMLLRRWSPSGNRVTTLAYNEPDPQVAARACIRVVRLWRRRAWQLHLLLRYLRNYDAVFYPGVAAADVVGLRWRRRLGLRAPLIATLEGLVGDPERERFYGAAAGHPVHCQPVTRQVLNRCDAVLEAADHVIAISPFLARMGRERYGDKFSVLPLGIDASVFYPPAARMHVRKRVVAAGHVEARKRPGLFLATAARFPRADFIWYGEGSLRHALTQQALARGIQNISLPGALQPSKLADEFRQADVFVLPSKTEGVPKVSQEAAACGLPVVLFGYYEAPSVEDGVNGFVVWSDEDFLDRVGELLDDPERTTLMGANGARMAKQWAWDVLAPQWESTVRGVLHPGCGSTGTR
jgi:glycosyltransferase involved in cell wall biosynthesis